jgi:acetyltransferase-like isoleucine patch superfamily enzyme
MSSSREEILKKYPELKNIPISTSSVFNDKNSLVILIQMFLTILIVFFVNSFYIDAVVFKQMYWLLFLLPLNIYGNIWLFVFANAVVSMVFVRILKKLHPIQEGVFPIDGKEFKYYKLRYWFSYFAIWLARAHPLPWIDFVVAKMLGSKIGRNVCLYDSWVDIELVDIGNHVMTSIDSVLLSHLVYQDKFIQLRTVICDNCIAGGQSIVAPGVIIHEGAILGGSCTTYIGQELAPNLIHVGQPAFKTLPIQVEVKPNTISEIKSEIKAETKKEKKSDIKKEEKSSKEVQH